MSETTTKSMWPALDATNEEWVAWASGWRSVAALNMRCLELGGNVGRFVVDDVPSPDNPNGSINGGMLAALADQVFGVMATWSSPRFVPATANLQTEFHRPLIGSAFIRAEVLPGGKRLQFIEAVMTDGSGQRCVTAHATMVAVSERPDLASAVDGVGPTK